MTIWPTYLYLEWPAQWLGVGTPLYWPSPPWPHRSVGEPQGQLLHGRGVTSPCSRGQLTGSCGWEETAWHQSHCDTQDGVHSGGEGAREWGEGLVYLLGMWTDSGDYLLSSVIKVLRVLKNTVRVLIMLLIKQLHKVKPQYLMINRIKKKLSCQMLHNGFFFSHWIIIIIIYDTKNDNT